eukprot:bmy_19092T0
MYVCKPETKIYFMVGEICLAILNHLKSILNYVCIYKCKKDSLCFVLNKACTVQLY